MSLLKDSNSTGITIVTNDSGTWVYNPTTNTWTNINGPKGDKGDAGVVGVEGMPGTNGTPGTPGSGTPGAPGAGVTIVTNDSGTWVYNPTTNTWTNINGPKGDKGDAGVVGVEGMPGTNGTPGTPGSGTPGAPGAGVTIVTNDSGTWVYNPTTNTWTNINGPKGDKGDAGVVGVEGMPGTNGTPGTPGSGTPGAPGAGITIVTNDSGTWVYNPTTNTWTNINGPKGDKGDAGVVGVEGMPGTNGTPGTPGSGTPGAPGTGVTIVTNDSGTWVYNPTTNTWTNINGPKGDKGDAGVVGVEGMPGTNGTPGTPGSGTPGAPGAGITIVTNDSGTWVYNPTTNTWTNINGPKGDKGDAGVVGVEGMPGTNGTPGTPGSGTPGAPGEGVTIVTNDSGTWVYNPTTNTWTNINGPKGDKGDAGVVGVEGMPGTNGTPGTPGSGTPGAPGAGITIVTNDSGTWVYNPTTNTWTNINGPKGDKGDAGVVGVEGMPGTNGTPGTPGSGTPGAPGAGITIVTNDSGTWVYNPTTNTWTNINGPKGDKGDAGVVGVEGMPGTNGTPGTPGSGTPGAPGAGITIVTNDSGTWVYNPTTNTWTNINGPKGDKGDAGVVGVEGMPGTNGTPGTPGSGTPGAPGEGVTIVTNDSGTWVYNPTTNTWTNINGPAGPQGPAGPAGADNITADNGLTKTGTNIQLGGELTKGTTIATTIGATTYPLNITGLPAGDVATDAIIVSGAGGQLKTVASSTLGIEPWQVENTSTKATTNTQNIYQNGNVGIGDFTASSPLAKLDVRGAIRGGANNFGLVGTNSAAFGYKNLADGDNSFAAGEENDVLGKNAVAIGYKNHTNSEYGAAIGIGHTISSTAIASMATGFSSTINGFASFTSGLNNWVNGNESAVFGSNNTSASKREFIIGENNAIKTSIGGEDFNGADPVFQIGNGVGPSTNDRNNAITVLKNAHTAIGVSGLEAAAKPTELLDLGGTATAGNGGLKIRNINSAAYAGNAATDRIVVANTDGVLKTIPAINTSVSNIVKITSAYTALATDVTILANATTVGFTLTIPVASAANKGRILIIRKTDETSNVLTFSSMIKISETTSFNTLNINTTIRIQSDGTDWYKID